MATVLRKNKAWLHGLIKHHLPEVVLSLCNSEIIPEEAKETALRGNVDASTRATDLLKVIEEKMMRDDIESRTFGTNFIQVLINSGIDKSGNLEKTEEEFREEQRRASRRSSVASPPRSLNSSSSSVFNDAPDERGNDKRRGSVDCGQRSSRSSLERRASDPLIASRSDSNSSVNLPQRSKSVSHTQSYESDEKCFEGHTLAEEQVGDLNSPVIFSHPPAFRLPSITENPNSPDIVKRFTSQAPSVEHSSSLPPQSGSINEGAVATTATDDEFEFSQQFITEESTIMQDFLHSACAAIDQRAVQENYEKMKKFYEQKMQEAEFAHHKETTELKATIKEHKRHRDEAEQKVMEKDNQLKHMSERLAERSSQLAEKEQEVYKLKEDKKIAEKECERLERQLHSKRKQIKLLNRNITQRELEIELLKTDQLLQSDVTGLEKNNKAIVRKKMEQWKEMKHLVDDLFKKSDNDHIPVKLLIIDKVNLIKTAGRRRPSTSYN